jgi:hypothetical protein
MKYVQRNLLSYKGKRKEKRGDRGRKKKSKERHILVQRKPT